jgi:hypothetical protein
MSVANLLKPNDLNLFCKSITTEIPPISQGKQIITNNTNNGTGNLQINQTDLSSTSNDIEFQNSGSPIFYVGENPINNDSYLWAGSALKFGTNYIERLRIPQSGIPINNTITTSILGLDGTILSIKNNILDTNSFQTLSNKTLNNPIINGYNLDTGIATSIIRQIPFSFSGILPTTTQIIFTIPTVTNTSYYVNLELVIANSTNRAETAVNNNGSMAVNNGGVLTISSTGVFNLFGNIGSILNTSGIQASGTNIQVFFSNDSGTQLYNITGTVKYMTVT